MLESDFLMRYVMRFMEQFTAILLAIIFDKKSENYDTALEKINECRGIAKAKEKLDGDELNDFKRSLRDLDDICVNPVTVPREWGIEHIPNPLRAYYNVAFEEQFLFDNEYRFNQLLEEYLAD